jgi:probable rRNA maturation factor
MLGAMDRQRAIYRPPWRIELTWRADTPRLLSDAEIARTIDRALEAAGAPRPATIGLILTGDEEITGLNEDQMGHDGATDVLSFPLLPAEAFPDHAGKSKDVGGSGPGSVAARHFAGPPGRRMLLGEIVISVERAIEQATGGRGGHSGDVCWSPADELRLLVTHGVLHVCGWDHADPVEGDAMRALELRLLSDEWRS